MWDEEVGAHDVEIAGNSSEDGMGQPAEAERVRLREILDKVLAESELDKPLDLEPIRSLVGKLVQSSGRHTDHAKDPPRIGVHSCAQEKHGCPACRYGFPHECFCRRCK